MAKYKKNFIKEVILRIDFENSIDSLVNYIPENIETTIFKFFTLKEVKDAFTQELFIDPNKIDIKSNKYKFKEFNFYGNERKKRLCLTKDFLFISFQVYISYNDFSNSFISVLHEMRNSFPELIVKRIGLRFINNIKITGDEPTKWDDYIAKDLLTIFRIPEDIKQISRAFQILELKIDDINLKFQYGMHNPDYPSTIKQKIFVLDIDSYKIGHLDYDEVEHKIPFLHNEIEKLFENSITDSLRDLMNE